MPHDTPGRHPDDTTTLLLVYNADAGLFNTLADTVHKALSPSTYACALCRITHSPLGVRDAWREFLEGLDMPVAFLHRDEFQRDHEHDERRDDPLPAIFVLRDGRLEPIVDARTLAAAGSIDDLKALVLGGLGGLG